MENSGIELEAAYRFRVSDWNFRIGGNLTYLKNKLIEYGNESGWANLDSFKVQVQSAVLRMVNLSHTSMDTKLQVYSRI